MSAVSRRAALLGSAGVVLTACGAAPRRPSAPASAPASGGFRSGFLRTRVGWRVVAPRGHDVGGLPVVLVLHGRSGTHTTAFSSLHLDDVLDRVVERGSAPFAVASVDGGDHSYYHRREDGTDAGSMIARELVPLLTDRGLDTGRLGLYGWSMGGYGALLLTSQKRLQPRAVAVSSPALFTSAGSTPAGAFDDAEDFRRNDVFAHPERLAGIPVRLDCGKSDPFYDATRDFAAKLPDAKTSFTDGRHDSAYWRRAAPGALRFLGERLSS